jgi:hypothetical protein
MDEPAKKSMAAIIEKATKNADELKKLGESAIALTKQTTLLAKYPNAVPKLLEAGPDAVRRLMDWDEAKLTAALSNPTELTQAIARANFADKFIGKSIPAPGTAARKEFDQAYRVGKNNVIYRLNAQDGHTALRVDADGNIQEVVGRRAVDRLSNPTQMQNNYIARHGAIPKEHQLHHLIPDAVVRDHKLAKLAREKAGYDLDDANNLIALPYTGDALKNAQVKIVHLGSHSKWSKHATEVLGDELRQLKKMLGTTDLSKVPDEKLIPALNKAMQNAEKRLGEDLKDINLGRQKGWITDYELKDGTTTIRLSQNDPQQTTPIQTANATQPPDLVALETNSAPSQRGQGSDSVISQNTSNTLSIDPTLQAEYQRHAQMIVSAVGDQSQILDEVLDVGIAAYAIGERWNDYSLAQNKAYARMVLANGSSVVQSMGSSVEVEQYLNETMEEAVIMAENSLVVEQQVQQTQNQIQIEYDA